MTQLLTSQCSSNTTALITATDASGHSDELVVAQVDSTKAAVPQVPKQRTPPIPKRIKLIDFNISEDDLEVLDSQLPQTKKTSNSPQTPVRPAPKANRLMSLITESKANEYQEKGFSPHLTCPTIEHLANKNGSSLREVVWKIYNKKLTT